MYIRIAEQNCRCGKNFNFNLFNPSHGHLFVRFKCYAKVLTANGYKDAAPGDFIFFNQNERIAYYTENDTVFLHDYFRFYLTEEEEGRFVIPTLRLFKAPLPEKLDELLRLITLEFYSGNQKKDESLELMGKLFMIGALELLSEENAPASSKIRDDILSLRIEMLSSPEKDWSVKRLAERSMISPSYFQTLYKKSFGISPINDLIEARIRKAEVYLISSEKKETEIALSCGYNNVEHFLRQFKALRGLTPSSFRKNGLKSKIKE